MPAPRRRSSIAWRPSTPIFADPYPTNRITAAFILIDEHNNETVAVGLIRVGTTAEAVRQARRGVTWHLSALDRAERWGTLSQRGGTVLLTGLPASGKSTIAVALERRLVDAGQAAYLLDGDNLRQGLSDDLGFDPGDRAEHIRRVGHVATMFADCGVVAVVSLISPLADDRELMRKAHVQAELPFVEVFVDTPVEECERRDPKGLYARARAGEIKAFTGIDAPYERPERPDVHVRTSEMTAEAAVDEILGQLRSQARR